MQVINLSEPTIFQELNKQEEKNLDYGRETIKVEKLKYKHIRAALKYPEIDQMHHLMMMVTGLNESDLGELLPEDAAKLTSILYSSLMKFNQPVN